MQLGSAAALPVGAVAANGGVLDLGGYSVTVSSFSGASGVVTSSGGPATLSVNQAGSTVFGGSLQNGSGALSLSFNGGQLALTGNNTNSGTNSVSGGTLQLGNGSSTGNLGSGPVALSNNARLNFDRSDNGLSVANGISGNGGVVQIGSGLTNLGGVNSYSGARSSRPAPCNWVARRPCLVGLSGPTAASSTWRAIA